MPASRPPAKRFRLRAHFGPDDRGVSETIGNVILVVMAVTMLGAFGGLVISSVSSDTPTPPSATFTIEPREGETFVLVRHVSGAFLDLDETHVLLDSNTSDVLGSIALVDGTNPAQWAPGETLRVDLSAGTLEPGARLFLMVIDDVTGKTVGTAWATVPADASATTILHNALGATLAFDRSQLTADGRTMVNATVTVASDLGLLLVDRVVLDLSPVGGDPGVTLFDDGVAPDAVGNDGQFTARFAVDNYTFTSLPGFANATLTANVSDVIGRHATTSAVLALVSPPVSKVGYGTEFRDVGSSGIISTTGFLNLTGFTFRDSGAVDDDQIEVRVADLADPTKAWSALVSFADDGCPSPSVTSVTLRRDGVPGSVTYTPAGGCFEVDVDARLNLANIHASLDNDLATSTWTPVGTESTFQYAAAGVGTSNEALIAYFGDITTTAPLATGLGQADLTWAPPIAGATAPSAITTLAGTPGNGYVDLAWTAPANGGAPITGYQIYRDGVLIDTIGTNVTYRAAGLTNGQSYDFVVRAVNAVGTSPASNTATATPAALPGAPQGFTAQPTIGRAYLNWSAPASNGGFPITGYRIHLNGTLFATIGTNTSFVALGLEHNTTYDWQVSAVTSQGEGPKTAITPASTPGVPDPALPFTAEAAVSRVYLNWTAPADDGGSPVTGYAIYRNGTLIDTIGTNTSYVVQGLEHNTTYQWQVAPVNGVGTGTRTPLTPAETPGLPYPPASLALTPAAGQVTLTWDEPDANGRPITAYQIFRNGTLIDAIGTNRTYVAAGLLNGVQYAFSVVAVNEVGASAPSSGAATPSALPTAPLALTAQPTAGRAYLNWSAPADDGGSAITAYRIYRNNTLHATIGTNTSFVALGLSANTTYDWQVAAVNANGEGARTSLVQAATPAVPYPPTSLAPAPGSTLVTLTWSAPANDGGRAVSAYRIYRNGTLIDTIGTNTSYVVNGLVNGVSYTLAVSAVNDVGEGNAASVSATPVSGATAPGVPTSFAVAATNGTAFVNWSAPASDGGSAITAYRIYRNGTLHATIGTNTSFVALGLLNNVTYTFSVSAVNAVGEGAQTSGLGATPGSIPYPPATLAASPGNRSATLTWALPAVDGGRALAGFNVYNASSGALIATTANGANTSFTVNGLTNGTLYSFRVTAVNAIGESAVSNTVTATPVGTPFPPTALAASSSNASVALTWTLPINNGGSALTGFRIVNASNGATVATTTNGANTSFTVNGLTNGFAYSYYVVALNAQGASSGSNTASATPASVPFPPSGLTATNATGRVNLSWSAPANNGGSAVTAYEVYRNGTLLLATIGTNLTYSDATGIAGVSYTYTVRAVNGVGTSGASNPAAGTAASGASVPGAPLNMVLTGAHQRVILAWAAPSSDGGSPITGYAIYRSTTNSTGSMALVTTIGTNTSYVDMGRTNGTTYYYQVSAINAAGEGARASIKDATPNGFIGVDCATYTLTVGNALTPSCIPLLTNDSSTTEFREPGGSGKEFNVTFTMNTTGLTGAFPLEFRGYRENSDEAISMYALNVTSGEYDLIGTILGTQTTPVTHRATVYSQHHWPAGILTIRFKDPGPDSGLSSWEIDYVGLVTT